MKKIEDLILSEKLSILLSLYGVACGLILSSLYAYTTGQSLSGDAVIWIVLHTILIGLAGYVLGFVPGVIVLHMRNRLIKKKAEKENI